MSDEPIRTGPPSSRVHVVAGSHNLRDLGGLRGHEGREVRRGRVFRSDYPGFAEHDEGAAVRLLGLRTVVDLRRGTEAEFECVAWPDHGVDYVRTPLSAGGETSWHARYHAYLTHRPETVVEAVRRAMAPAGHPALFHCAAGKDRTGVVAALLLALLGVADDEIVADYVLTADNLAPILARLADAGPYAEMLADSSYDDQVPRTENMAGFLAWLGEHGGAEAWLTEHGVSEEEIAAFRTTMLVEEADGADGADGAE